jgi:hypothetical protein
VQGYSITHLKVSTQVESSAKLGCMAYHVFIGNRGQLCTIMSKKVTCVHLPCLLSLADCLRSWRVMSLNTTSMCYHWSFHIFNHMPAFLPCWLPQVLACYVPIMTNYVLPYYQTH